MRASFVFKVRLRLLLALGELLARKSGTPRTPLSRAVRDGAARYYQKSERVASRIRDSALLFFELT
jgi:hypothetical protein